MGLVPDKEQGVVTTSREEFRDMPRGWAVGEVLVDSGGGLQSRGDNGTGFCASASGRCAKSSDVRASGNQRCCQSGGLLDPLGTERALCVRTDPFGWVTSIRMANDVEALQVAAQRCTLRAQGLRSSTSPEAR